MVAIAQRFKMPDLQAEPEVEVLIPFVRIIPSLGVLIGDRHEDKKQQAVSGPYAQGRHACQRYMHGWSLHCEIGKHGTVGGKTATSAIVSIQPAVCPIVDRRELRDDWQSKFGQQDSWNQGDCR
jgi:hypothetical protein